MTNPALPIIYIKAVNPGYTVDGKTNVGEMIELARNDDSDVPLSLAGLKLGYTNSSGNSTDLLEFPENSWLTGEGLLLHFSDSPESAHLTYLKTLAMKAGPLELILNGEVIDSVCWTGKDGCNDAFSSATPTTLVREPDSTDFSHLESYEPSFNVDDFLLEEGTNDQPSAESAPSSQCTGLEFSEILSYFKDSREEQFIEIFNPTAGKIELSGCKVKYKNKFLPLEGVIEAGKYQAFRPTEFQLTKSPTSSNKLELLNPDDSLVDTLIYYSGQKKSTAYAKFGVDETGEALWQITYQPTPGAANVLAEYPPCEDGKIINKETGNCVKIIEETTKTCPDGYYLNPSTNRCKKYNTTTAKTCAEGYYLNPLTNRCKKITLNTGADFPAFQEEFQVETTFSALWAVIILIVIGVSYVIFQFRTQLKSLFGRVFRSSR
ncbi:hypothetical protein IKH83_03495 [Candidatus Saccharibacteria bacterium]|nr:hypothetical protein [Candidatus Saccharibacteria bacterium]